MNTKLRVKEKFVQKRSKVIARSFCQTQAEQMHHDFERARLYFLLNESSEEGCNLSNKGNNR
jgi:hypothetical protein